MAGGLVDSMDRRTGYDRKNFSGQKSDIDPLSVSRRPYVRWSNLEPGAADHHPST